MSTSKSFDHFFIHQIILNLRSRLVTVGGNALCICILYVYTHYTIMKDEERYKPADTRSNGLLSFLFSENLQFPKALFNYFLVNIQYKMKFIWKHLQPSLCEYVYSQFSFLHKMMARKKTLKQFSENYYNDYFLLNFFGS